MQPSSPPPTPLIQDSPFSPPPHTPSITPLSPNPPNPFLFPSWHQTQQPRWSQWLEKLKPIYADTWRSAGIHDAVVSSTVSVRRDVESIRTCLAYWRAETNTFAFPWGEATLTLDDARALGVFSVLGECVRATRDTDTRAQELYEELVRVRRKMQRTTAKKASHALWLRHFIEGCKGGEIEHVAFLSLWLSRHVFPSHNTVDERFFSIAIRLTRGTRLALAPTVLASVYRDLRALTTGGRGDKAPLWLLQLWLRERFPRLQTKPTAGAGTIRAVLNSREEFRWRPHAAGDAHSLARCLRACELVGMDCIEQYLPHRVSMQFGFDQGVPGRVPIANACWETAWATYDAPLQGTELVLPSRGFEPGVTVEYREWWGHSTKGVESGSNDMDDVPLSELMKIMKRQGCAKRT
ncbi:hypothetical protein QJS10_CPA10g01649 [Acorus calamus]|uniref:Aminotransferase-like plant mobile domain-containing protein n=1 Tax=Acorus calamus TaxID=4465 RepID=A0AAV9DYR1_ACOCL|nr:hypothetical protein QJS10_CPA10g01649 [Acorus calamus]